MSDLTTIAKPYANAVYELAKEQSAVSTWQVLLSAGKALVATEPMQQLLAMPELDRRQLAAVLIRLLGDKVDASGQNFLQLLAKNHRVGLLGEIADQYDALRARDENKTQVNVTTAVEVDDALKDSLKQALNQKLATETALNFTVDEAIIGGVVLQMGDKVIDSSLQNALRQLQKKLNIGSARC